MQRRSDDGTRRSEARNPPSRGGAGLRPGGGEVPRSVRLRLLSVLLPLALAVPALLVTGVDGEGEAAAGATSRAAPEMTAGQRLRSGMARTETEVLAGSRGCLACHAGIEPIHASPAVRISCTDCHGGDPEPAPPASAAPGDEAYERAKEAAHVARRYPERWRYPEGAGPSANPLRSWTLTLEEPAEVIRFVNPGDLRVAGETCGPCHQEQVNTVLKSPMTTSAIFWAAAAYANGILGNKAAVLGESYGRDGGGQAIVPSEPPSPADRARGALPVLFPLPRWEVTQPGEYFRAFERGGILNPSFFPEIGNPNPVDVPGRPDIRVSNRGRGTGLRVSPGVINLHKTRLNDPHLSMFGTNDHPGDYRGSGCTACHLVYANDRDPNHSGPYARFGHGGRSVSGDPTLPEDEPGHPLRHRLTRAIPTSQCMVCHMHQPNSFLNTYLGYTMWDYETDGEHLWPEEQRYPTAEERREVLEHNPEGAAPRGLWGDPEFLEGVADLNPELEHTRFADYHGHGWVFRAVYKRDRQGRLLDEEGRVVPFDDPQRFDRAVHLKDIHLERGMHCVDCHFSRDVHGNGLLYGEYGNAIEIACEDCHGTVEAVTDLTTSGPAAPPGGTDLSLATTPFGQRRFLWRGGELFQRSSVEEGLEWEVAQVRDTVDPAHAAYNPRSARAKTLRSRRRADPGQEWPGEAWGALPEDHPAVDAPYAHGDEQMTCYACHSSWITSCFGCHLPQKANERSDMHRYEGIETRNYATYNPQVIRTDVYMLGINGSVLGNRIAPVRSSSALVLSSENLNRQRIYIQQPPISAPGFSSQAFNPHVPHTVRTTETRACSDCHLSEDGDNNAWMSQLLTLGTGYVNFLGRYAWVAQGEEGVEAVAVTEWDEPQAVLGSFLHRLAYPDFFRAHGERHGELELAHHHPSSGPVVSLQLRGEYLYTVQGSWGLEVYDVANVDNKDFSERVITAPVSPVGQRTRVRTRDATAVALPTTMPMALDREGDPANQEQPIHPLYRYAYLTDREEGLILVDVATLTDGEPRNNFLERAVTFNPEGKLTGAENLTVAGHHVYVVRQPRAGQGEGGPARGELVVVDVSEPLAPRIAAVLPGFEDPTSVALQFRYAFVTDGRGLTVVDVTHPERPRRAAAVELGPSHNVYPARTYAYVAAGPRGLAIVDVERPEAPRVDRVFTAGGKLADVRDVQVASTGSSLFAYVADAGTGLHVLQLTSPETVPGYLGFSPRPQPEWIAGRHTHGPALAISRGLDRDRAVDETGHQVSVFNRLGARPFTQEEMERLYLRDGEVYVVRDQVEEEEREEERR